MDIYKYSGASARTHKLLLNHAIEITESGHVPSLNELAQTAEASRATVYRYFPSHADLVHAMMTQSLSNLIGWQPTADTPLQRLREAYELLFEDFKLHETLFRAVLQLVLLPTQAEQLSQQMSDRKQHSRGLRVDILKRVIEPLSSQLSSRQNDELLQKLSLLFGIESLVVLKDIWGMDLDQAKRLLFACAETFIKESLNSSVTLD
jgi:AcrR family transcriptional regulator